MGGMFVNWYSKQDYSKIVKTCVFTLTFLFRCCVIAKLWIKQIFDSLPHLPSEAGGACRKRPDERSLRSSRSSWAPWESGEFEASRWLQSLQAGSFSVFCLFFFDHFLLKEKQGPESRRHLGQRSSGEAKDWLGPFVIFVQSLLNILNYIIYTLLLLGIGDKGGCFKWNRQTRRQFKPEKKNSCQHGNNCEFCHQDHKRPKHRSQRGRHNLQKKEFEEQRNSLPQELTKTIDRVYCVTDEEQKQMKKHVKNIASLDKTFQERVEAKLLATIKRIGQEAQDMRPDNARSRKTSEPDEGQVDLVSRCKWFSGTLHLLVRKLFDSEKNPDLTGIASKVDECLSKLQDETKKVEKWACEVAVAEDRFQKFRGQSDAWLEQKIHELAREAILKGKFQEESVKELCLDSSRLQTKNLEEKTEKSMQEASSLDNLLVLVRTEVDEQSQKVLQEPEVPQEFVEWHEPLSAQGKVSWLPECLQDECSGILISCTIHSSW